MALFPSREAPPASLSLLCPRCPCLLLPWLGTRAPWVAPAPPEEEEGRAGECLGTGEGQGLVSVWFWWRREGRDPVGWLFFYATSGWLSW